MRLRRLLLAGGTVHRPGAREVAFLLERSPACSDSFRGSGEAGAVRPVASAPRIPASLRGAGARLWLRKARVRQRGGKGVLGPSQQDLAGCNAIGVSQ